MNMKFATFLVAGACILALPPAPAHAQRVSMMAGGKFLQDLQRATRVPACDAYIAGMADSFALIQKLAAHTPADASMKLPVCIPTATRQPRYVATWCPG